MISSVYVALMRRSYLARLVRMAQLKLALWIENRNGPVVETGGGLEQSPDLTPLSSNFVKQLNKKITASGSKLAIFVVPSKYNLMSNAETSGQPEYSSKWKTWAADNGIAFIDLVGPFRVAARGGQQPFFKNDIHFNALGHEIAARTICRDFPAYFSSSTCK